jgi:hypothetical protein
MRKNMDCNINLSAIQLPPPPSQPKPTPESHPAIRFWQKADYLKWREKTAAPGMIKLCGKLPYLEDTDGKHLDDAIVKSIRKLLRAGWNELLSHEVAPQKWGQATQAVHAHIKVLWNVHFPFSCSLTMGGNSIISSSPTICLGRVGGLERSTRCGKEKRKLSQRWRLTTITRVTTMSATLSTMISIIEVTLRVSWVMVVRRVLPSQQWALGASARVLPMALPPP